MKMQSALSRLYPPQCLTCRALVDSDFGLCGRCWRDTPFITGLVCDKCGAPLPGEDGGTETLCDDCITVARPWKRGRAAMLYRDNARKLVLELKHGDRTELCRPAAGWLVQAAAPLLSPGMIVAPVPLHWSRLLRRRYNQAALLAGAFARRAGLDHCPDLLRRTRRTRTLEGIGREARFRAVAGTISAHPRRARLMAGRSVLLVDDVMTSGATLAAAADACHAAGAAQVFTVTLARVAKDT